MEVMTLDEAIKHAEEVAEEEERKCTDGQLWSVNESRRKCASEHHQLVEWLKDYKRLLEFESSYNSIKNDFKKEPCEGNVYLTREAYGELCYKASKWNELEMCEDAISRQEAIDALKQQAEEMTHWSERYAEQRKGILTAINIVSDLPFAQPMQSNTPNTLDAISRAEAIWVASGYCHPANVAKELAMLPSVNPAPCEDVPDINVGMCKTESEDKE